MVNLDDELAQDYFAECNDRLIRIEADLLEIEEGGAGVDLESMDRALRQLRWVQEGASVFHLEKIRDQAHQMERALGLIRSGQKVSTPNRIRALLGAVDSLRDLVDPSGERAPDAAEIMAGLAAPRHLRVLLVEDDFSSRLLLQTYLSGYGECHIAVNGREAVEAFRFALEHGQRYDAIFMDIMMPEMDGRQAVGQIRALEEEFGILSTSGAKIFMTTAVDDIKEVVRCFHELCDSYLTKPVDPDTLLRQMKSCRLIK
jgi:two-component system chemotaxis response regulator CheY